MNYSKNRMIHTGLFAAFAVISLASGPVVYGDEAANKALEERIKRDFQTKKEMDARKQAEANRDKSHDGRVKTGPNSSVGGKVSPDGGSVDFKHKF